MIHIEITAEGKNAVFALFFNRFQRFLWWKKTGVFMEFCVKEKKPSSAGTLNGFCSQLEVEFSELQNDNITLDNNSQDLPLTLLSSQLNNDLSDRFTSKKLSSSFLSDSYYRLGLLSKSVKVGECGNFLSFVSEVDSDGFLSNNFRLHSANFCKDRLCPMCSWRRSLKIFSQVSQILEPIQNDYKFLFLTLTVPNVSKTDLNLTIDRMMSAFHRFIGYRCFDFVQGYFRALEITRNKKTGFYHPHFHCVLAVPLSYGKKCYASRSLFLEKWQKAFRDKSITQVDIRLARPKDKEGIECSNRLAAAVAEIAKYSVKDSDYLIQNRPSLTDDIVNTLSSALFHRRLVAYGGILKERFNQLHFVDIDSDEVDLIHINDERILPDIAYMIVNFKWSAGAYNLFDISFSNEV